MKKNLATACAALSLLCLIPALSFLAFEQIACDGGAYTRLQDRYDLYDEIGVSREEMVPAMQSLAAYIRGEAVDYNPTVTMFGSQRPLFGENELLHMVDVLALFRLERAVGRGLLAAGLSCLVLCLLSPHRRRALRRGLPIGGGIFAALLLFCAVGYALLGFDRIFLNFHYLFFHNDLWLMSYQRDAMIRMFPSQFFEAMVSEILERVLVCAAAGCLGFAALWVCAGRRPKSSKAS